MANDLIRILKQATSVGSVAEAGESNVDDEVTNLLPGVPGFTPGKVGDYRI
jgi:hypothetical protein